MTRLRLLLLASCVAAASATVASPQDPIVPIPIRHETLYSAKLGESRELWISLPDSYLGSTERYPVVYLLDGELNFRSGCIGAVRQAAMLDEMPEFILVAIRNTDRARDIFPEEVTFSDGSKAGGRADAFLAFIETELIPYVEKTYRTDTYRVLYGTSNTGFTAVYALFHNPALADTVIAASATLRVTSFQTSVSKLVSGFSAGRKRLILVMGENDLPTVLSLNGALKEAVDMSAPPGLTCRLAVVRDGEHVPVTSLVEGLRLAFDGWKLTQKLTWQTFAEVREQVDSRAARFGVQGKLPEETLGQFSRTLLDEEKAAEALEASRYWVASYPSSAEAEVGLGDALRKLGKAESAMECYRKALDLDPHNAAAKARLAELGT